MKIQRSAMCLEGIRLCYNMLIILVSFKQKQFSGSFLPSGQ